MGTLTAVEYPATPEHFKKLRPGGYAATLLLANAQIVATWLHG